MIEFINDCLIAMLFLAAGLEIKCELLVGEPPSFRKAALPFAAACGGMVVPVLICSLLVIPDIPEARGMAIPVAMGIAFSLRVLSLLDRRVPLSLKIFLTAFAMVDDIGGMLVIASFYSIDVAYGYLIVAIILYIFPYHMGKLGVVQKIFFLLFGIIIWYLFLQSGVHSTISGVVLTFVISARPRLDVGKYIKRIRGIVGESPTSKSDNIVLTNAQIATLKQVERASDHIISPLQSLEDNLRRTVNFMILFLLAFVNTDAVFNGSGDIVGDISIAVATGLLLGKFPGIYLFMWLSTKSGSALMPVGVNWRNIAGVSLPGDIGFTVSLSVANLSLVDAYPELLNQAKFGVFLGTLLVGVLGYVVPNIVLPKAE